MDKTQFCCESFIKIAQTFKWFIYEKEGVKIFTMPTIEVDGQFWRVNNCPSCGRLIRSIEIHEDEYNEITNGNIV